MAKSVSGSDHGEDLCPEWCQYKDVHAEERRRAAGSGYEYVFGTLHTNPLETFWSEGARTPDALARRLRTEPGLVGWKGNVIRQAYAAGLRGRNQKERFLQEACAMYVAAWLKQREEGLA